MLKIQPSSTLEYSFFRQFKTLPTRFVEATRVRVSTSEYECQNEETRKWVLGQVSTCWPNYYPPLNLDAVIERPHNWKAMQNAEPMLLLLTISDFWISSPLEFEQYWIIWIIEESNDSSWKQISLNYIHLYHYYSSYLCEENRRSTNYA